jgi:NarL family two-component system sensor histidine kinase LiaS
VKDSGKDSRNQGNSRIQAGWEWKKGCDMAIVLNKAGTTLRQLRWKLTLSYSAVTVGALLVVVLILGILLFSKVLVPLDILNSVLTSEAWIQLARDNAPSVWRYILSQRPIDQHLLSLLMQNYDLQVTYFDLFRIGDLQIRFRTLGEGTVFLIDSDGILLGVSNPDFVLEDAIGRPLDMEILPGLEVPLRTALNGEIDPDRLFVTLEPNERFYFAIPYLDEFDQEVLGVAILYFESFPTENDLSANTLTLLSRSVLILLFTAGLVGTFFGFLTAKGMVRRLQRVSEVADAWSEGDFSEFIEDPVGDEISHLGQKLNQMASQLKDLLKRRQEMAVSEERNRLARDLHDSAKQQALAASFQLGTAITLFDREPDTAKNHLIEADHLVNSVRVELTDLIHELRPPTMNGQDFTVTLNDYAIEWAHQNGIEVNVDVQGNNGLSLEAKQTLFRILQEALANVNRHSAANSVAVSLNYAEHVVVLTIADDGCGFDTSAQHDGMGLNSMWERAESLNGEFTVESELGEGTRITVTLPMS